MLSRYEDIVIHSENYLIIKNMKDLYTYNSLYNDIYKKALNDCLFGMYFTNATYHVCCVNKTTFLGSLLTHNGNLGVNPLQYKFGSYTYIQQFLTPNLINKNIRNDILLKFIKERSVMNMLLGHYKLESYTTILSNTNNIQQIINVDSIMLNKSNYILKSYGNMDQIDIALKYQNIYENYLYIFEKFIIEYNNSTIFKKLELKAHYANDYNIIKNYNIFYINNSNLMNDLNNIFDN